MLVEGGKFEVKLVPSQGHREEVIVNIISALDNLASITAHVFDSISERIGEQRQAVTELSSRVSAAADKVSSIKTCQKGIRIVSPAKYPYDPEVTRNGSIFRDSFPVLRAKAVPPQGSTIRREVLENIRSGVDVTNPPVKNASDLLQHYHTRDTTSASMTLDKIESLNARGLGLPPSKLKTLDSFLLFNTNDNAYASGAGKSTRKAKAVPSKTEEVGEPVPAITPSRADTLLNDKEEDDDFWYNPSSVSIPELEVPDMLPNLPGIAGKLFLPSFSESNGLLPSRPVPSTSSVPSSSKLEQPSVPSFSTMEAKKEPSKIDAKSIVADTNVPAPPPPPMPPPLYEADKPVPTPSVVPSVNQNASCAPPPPPPPMPMPVPPSDAQTGLDKPDSAAKPVPKPVVPDVRSNLMEAIRAAGGTGGLKPAKERKPDDVPKSTKTAQNEPMDMLADLKNSLAMRRKGISGANSANQSGGLSNIMNKLAASIPALDDSNEETAGADDDDDWD